jgi:hypothetical protein
MTAALEWAEPGALWALALALPVAALHLYRRRRRRLDVAFAPMLREAAGAPRPFAAWRRLADRASLVLRLLALACLVLAWAGPRAEPGAEPRDLVLVVDLDVTTRAREEGGATRLDLEKRLARRLVAAHGPGRAAVVAAGAVPRVASPLEEGSSAALDALRGLSPEAGRADLAAALRVARSVARGERPARVVAVTSRALPPGEADGVEAAGAGTASDDQGFVDVAVVADAEGPKAVVRLVVANFADAARSRTLAGRREGTTEPPFPPRRVDLPARGEATVEVTVSRPRAGGLLEARLEGEDALREDDAVALVLPPPLRPSVLVVHAGAPRPWVPALLEALGEAVDASASGTVAAADARAAAPRDVAVVDGATPLASAPPAAGWVLVGPFPASAPWLPFAPGRLVREPVVWRADPSHPLLRGVDLATARVARATTLGGPGVATLATVEGEAVVAEGRAGGVPWVAIGIDPDESDLPLRAAFPLLLRNAIRRVAAAPRAPLEPFYRAGTPMRPRLPWPGEGTVEFAWGEGGPEPARTATWDPLGVEEPPAAPAGGPLVVRASSGGSGGPRHRTVALDLDRARDPRPARPASAGPVATASPPAEAGTAWREALLAAAAALVLLDLGLLVVRPKSVAPAPRTA